MENLMGTTIVSWGIYWGYIGTMEDKMLVYEILLDWFLCSCEVRKLHFF